MNSGRIKRLVYSCGLACARESTPKSCINRIRDYCTIKNIPGWDNPPSWRYGVRIALTLTIYLVQYRCTCVLSHPRVHFTLPFI